LAANIVVLAGASCFITRRVKHSFLADLRYPQHGSIVLMVAHQTFNLLILSYKSMGNIILKVCSICKQSKPLSDFNKNKLKGDGLQTHCRECNRIASKKYYHKNKEHHYKNTKERQKKQIGIAQEFIWMYLSTHPCVDCKEKDPIVLDFDHIKDKSYNISDMIYTGIRLETIVSEIEKCEVRCANCHRRKTAKQSNCFRFQKSMGL
jgi:5-methylcytosine-specific restriction endonuclease McrA